MVIVVSNTIERPAALPFTGRRSARSLLFDFIVEISHASTLIFHRLRAFFETLDNEKQPGFLCPDYAGFLGITEKHFYDSLTSVLDDPNVDCR